MCNEVANTSSALILLSCWSLLKVSIHVLMATIAMWMTMLTTVATTPNNTKKHNKNNSNNNSNDNNNNELLSIFFLIVINVMLLPLMSLLMVIDDRQYWWSSLMVIVDVAATIMLVVIVDVIFDVNVTILLMVIIDGNRWLFGTIVDGHHRWHRYHAWYHRRCSLSMWLSMISSQCWWFCDLVLWFSRGHCCWCCCCCCCCQFWCGHCWWSLSSWLMHVDGHEWLMSFGHCCYCRFFVLLLSL